ncbi:hypothetical protein SUGI_0351690 [Cryptomeria japonica]|nr:hypothetical protein SUGI_0351690 [Cryptomeria japonica]
MGEHACGQGAVRASREVTGDGEDGDFDGEEDCVGLLEALLVSFLPFLGFVLVVFGVSFVRFLLAFGVSSLSSTCVVWGG